MIVEKRGPEQQKSQKFGYLSEEFEKLAIKQKFQTKSREIRKKLENCV